MAPGIWRFYAPTSQSSDRFSSSWLLRECIINPEETLQDFLEKKVAFSNKGHDFPSKLMKCGG